MATRALRRHLPPLRVPWLQRAQFCAVPPTMENPPRVAASARLSGRARVRARSRQSLSQQVAEQDAEQSESAASAPEDDGTTPGLRRLCLSPERLDSLRKLGRERGPASALEHLVAEQKLEVDSSQAVCSHTLQQLWQVIAEQDKALKQWEQDMEQFRRSHDQWRMRQEEKQSHKVDSEASSDGALEKKTLPDESDVQADPEPSPPERPVPATHGCYVWGGVGGGKSLLMDLFAECCGPGSSAAASVRRVHFHEFMHEVHLELHRLRQAGAERTTREVAKQVASKVRVLAFDEFQMTDIADALIIETLFDTLFSEGVYIVMTTNRPPEDLYKDGLHRHLAIPQFLAMLERRGVTIHELSAARDFRQPPEPADQLSELKPQDSSWRDYFICSDASDDGSEATSSSALGRVFAEVAGAEKGEPATIPIAWGRSLHVPESLNGVGRFHFQQLCGSSARKDDAAAVLSNDPLGADDYLRLAKAFHTVILDGVPKFTTEQHNEVRRFTNLVDCLYEHHVRLIVSAGAPPDELLSQMEILAFLNLQPSGAPSPIPGLEAFRQAQVQDPFTFGMSQTSSLGGQASGRAGMDESSTGAQANGVMASAMGSLQESGFAARRATSRLLHMQTEEYLRTHQQNRLPRKKA
mmetsp:Transcript_68197/g.163645  ORF Transcript_68197/g.163645 Transcript_68197/m.163645 type:complete len:639 (-) Transcript_68197:132-2048(-)